MAYNYYTSFGPVKETKNFFTLFSAVSVIMYVREIQVGIIGE